MEIPGAAVVTEAGPCRLDRLDPGLRQRVETGKAVQEALVPGRDDLAPGLLEHDLPNENLVRILGSTPRQIAPAAVEPGQQRTPELLRLD